jgi:hypothetical protein
VAGGRTEEDGTARASGGLEADTGRVDGVVTLAACDACGRTLAAR